jgi:CRISPR/Cas system-associated exonuclease Cas4 (RecB family)
VLYDRVIEIKTAVRGADHLETAATQHCKANALRLKGGEANLAAAIALCDRIIEVKTAVLGANHPSTAGTLQVKATALEAYLMAADTLHAKATALVNTSGLENLATAIALYDRVIEIKTAALGADHPQTAAAVRLKASVLTLAAMRCARMLLFMQPRMP